MCIDQMNYYQRKLAYEMDSWEIYVAVGENEPITAVDGRMSKSIFRVHSICPTGKSASIPLSRSTNRRSMSATATPQPRQR